MCCVLSSPQTTGEGINVIQLETAAGAAIQNFKGAVGEGCSSSSSSPLHFYLIHFLTSSSSSSCPFRSGVNVPRSRFLPVKKTSDLLVVMSNLFMLREGSLVRNPARSIPTLPLVKLGDQHFTKVRKMYYLLYSQTFLPELLFWWFTYLLYQRNNLWVWLNGKRFAV